MIADITPGQTSDCLGFDLVMADNLPEPAVLLADRGYDSDTVRKNHGDAHMVPVIPMRKTRKLRIAVDHTLYRLRTLVERCFNKLTNARRVATRYNKTPESFPTFINITSIRRCLRHRQHDLAVSRLPLHHQLEEWPRPIARSAWERLRHDSYPKAFVSAVAPSATARLWL